MIRTTRRPRFLRCTQPHHTSVHHERDGKQKRQIARIESRAEQTPKTTEKKKNTAVLPVKYMALSPPTFPYRNTREEIRSLGGPPDANQETHERSESSRCLPCGSNTAPSFSLAASTKTRPDTNKQSRALVTSKSPRPICMHAFVVTAVVHGTQLPFYSVF
ncbi:unnamed protein product, partial [Ectocarpus sp. 8 AP-2014]